MTEDNEILKALQKAGKRTEITIETHTTTVIRTTSGRLGTAFCRTCGMDTADLSTTNAASILQVGQDELELFTRTGDLHLTENGGLCGNSLAAYRAHDISPTKLLGSQE